MAFKDCAMKTTRYKEMPFFLPSQLQMSSQEISVFYVNSSLKVENNKRLKHTLKSFFHYVVRTMRTKEIMSTTQRKKEVKIIQS